MLDPSSKSHASSASTHNSPKAGVRQRRGTGLKRLSLVVSDHHSSSSAKEQSCLNDGFGVPIPTLTGKKMKGPYYYLTSAGAIRTGFLVLTGSELYTYSTRQAKVHDRLYVLSLSATTRLK